MAEDDDPYEQYHQVVRAVLGPRTEQVLRDKAWAALGATLSRVERAGYDPVTVLGRAVEQGSMVNARSAAQLLTWRINRELPRPERAPGAAAPGGAAAAATVPTQARPAGAGATSPSAAAATSPPPPTTAAATPAGATRTGEPVISVPGDGVPGWRERPLGAMGDADLQTRLSTVRAEATQAAVVARHARESATTAMEVARSRRGPAHTAVAERHAELSARVQAIDALARLDAEYRQVRQVGGFGNQTPDELRARLAVGEARLKERAFFGLVHAVRGADRRELTERVTALRDYIENTGPRLAELDAQRAGLERAAGLGATREAAYREWLVTDRELPQQLDAARASDIEAAHQAHREADRLSAWAQERGEEHDQLQTEAATRRGLPTERAEAEQGERTEAAAALVAAAAVATAAAAAAGAVVVGEVVESVVEEVVEAVAEVETSRGRSA
ncbi:hypothetical protein ACFV1W_25310 [Kitasatospora sp. NPDC059648]|uniref:hypothetical protein n=1 Tax=Kitasatospora sp. NPDC059648 TaxID=3346894 RepID=UPI003696A89B